MNVPVLQNYIVSNKITFHRYAFSCKISLYVLNMFNLYFFFVFLLNLLFSIHTFIRNLFLIRITCLTFHIPILNSVFNKLLLHIKSYDTKTSTPCATSNLSIFSCKFFFFLYKKLVTVKISLYSESMWCWISIALMCKKKNYNVIKIVENHYNRVVVAYKNDKSNFTST